MSGSTSPIPGTAAQSPRALHLLRLWPGLVIVILMWLVRVLGTLGTPSPMQFFMVYMINPLVALGLVCIWWLLLSRLRWADRFLVLGVFALAAAAAIAVCGQNFPPMTLIIYVLPIVLSVWVGWLLLTIRFDWPVRRAGLAALLVLSACCCMPLRVDGMDGSFATKFSFRWHPTPEQLLLQELAAAGPAAPASESADAPAVETLELQPGDWPGFRGAARDGRLVGVRIATDWDQTPPKPLWKHRIGPGWSSLAAVGNRAFTQEQRGEKELVTCYNTETGAEMWAHADDARFSEVVAGPGPRGTPTFDNGRIYAQGASGILNCLDAATGKVIWSRDVAKDSGAKLPVWGFSSSPLVWQGVVTIFAGGPEGKSVLGYQAADGKLAWSAGEGLLSYCSPQPARLGGIDQLLIATEAGLTAFVPESGKVLWKHDWPTEGVARIVQPAVLGDTDLLVGTGMGVGTRRLTIGHESDTWPIKEQWTTKTIKPYYNDLVVSGDQLYGFDGNIFMCVGLDDGQIRWRKRGYGNGQVLLLADQNLLLILSEEGEVALVEAVPGGHHEIARFKALEGKTWNHPVIAHGKLLVRNGEEIACFALKPLADEPAQAKANEGEEKTPL